MHTETVGYISINKDDMDEIREAINNCDLSDLDCHPSEIMTEVDPKLINILKDHIITNEDARTLLSK